MYTEGLLDYCFLDIKKNMDLSKYVYLNFEINPNINIKNNINRFYNALSDNISEDNLKLFYKNIKSLNIKNRIAISDVMSSVISGSYVSGVYCVKDNTIFLASYYGMFNSDLTHELLHMSSGIYDFNNNIDYCGLSQNYNNNKIGYALNEGYTELLNKRLFSLGVDNSYIYEVFISSLIENILGKDKLENYYFNADLLGAVNELAKYSNRTKVDRFLIRSDYLLYNLNKIFFLPKNRNKVNNAFDYINDFLIESSLSKEIISIKDGLLSTTEALDKFNFFADKMCDVVKFNYYCDKVDTLNNINYNLDKGIKVLKKM